MSVCNILKHFQVRFAHKVTSFSSSPIPSKTHVLYSDLNYSSYFSLFFPNSIVSLNINQSTITGTPLRVSRPAISETKIKQHSFNQTNCSWSALVCAVLITVLRNLIIKISSEKFKEGNTNRGYSENYRLYKPA